MATEKPASKPEVGKDLAQQTPPSDGQPRHDPQRVAAELGAKLATRSRHVCFLTGAGTSKAAGLPDLAGLTKAVTDFASADDKNLLSSLLNSRNLEEALSRVRRITSLLDQGGTFDGFDHSVAKRIDATICSSIIKAITQKTPDLKPFQALATWAAGEFYSLPIEIFTVNYDTLLEEGLESRVSPYFDGFVGTMRASFRPDLVERTNPREPGAVPEAFVRVWKLHGSITWAMEERNNVRRVVRLGVPVSGSDPAAIYPSEEKYDASQRVPFVVLMDRFRHALHEPETILLVTGYSFGDQHLNEVIFDAAQVRPRSETVVFSRTAIPPAVVERAQQIPNLTALGASEAIIGGVKGPWGKSAQQIPSVWENDRFLLGDFANLATFLGRTRARETEQKPDD